MNQKNVPLFSWVLPGTYKNITSKLDKVLCFPFCKVYLNKYGSLYTMYFELMLLR